MATNYFRMDGWVKSAQGPAVPGAQIYVCTQPANDTSLPPTPLANIFSDVNGLVPLPQPIITDGFGHYDFYASAAVYTIVVGLGGVVQQVYSDQSLGGASGSTGGGGGTALILSTNGVQNPNQLALNVESTDDSIGISVDSAGNLDLIGAPVASADFMFGPGNFQFTDNLVQGNGVFTAVPNRVYFVRFSTPFSLNFSKLSFTAGNGLLAGGDCNFGIYSSDGTTRLWQLGPTHVNNVSNQDFDVTLTPHVVLAPGTYLLAFTAQDADQTTVWSFSIPGIYFNSGSSDRNLINRSGVVSYGFATNAAPAGPIMPTSLGTLIPATSSDPGTVPALFFVK